MGGVIAGTLALALAVAISPMRTSAAIVVLLSDQARRAGLLYLAGFATGIALATGVGLYLGTTVEFDEHYSSRTGVSVVLLVSGLLLLGFASWSWMSRPQDSETPVLPRWMRSVESASPLVALAVGFGLAVFSFKNLGLILAAAFVIDQADLSAVTMTLLAIAFIVVACLGVLLPVGWFVLAGARSTETLIGWKAWLTQYNGPVTAGATALGGLYLAGTGLSGLLG